MAITVHHGSGSACDTAWDGVTIVGPAPHQAIGAGEVAAAVWAALGAPLGYPPLVAATVPGDRVAVAFDAALPLVRELADGVARALDDAGVDQSATTFLYGGASGTSGPLDDWTSDRGLHAERHDSGGENSCSMFGVSQTGQPLRLNRKLCDADVVVPVCAAQVLPTGEGGGRFAGMFPQFSDDETIARHRDDDGAKQQGRRRERRAEVDEAGWLLGVGLAVQVVPSAGGLVAAVIAGEPGAAAEAAERKYREVWQRPVEAAGDLVIATLTGPASEHSWDNVARAIVAAESVLAAGGAIALCTQLDEPPGPSLRRLTSGDDSEQLERILQCDTGPDAHAARIIFRALQRGPVYLSSNLAPEDVENLGLAPIASEAELGRLVKSYHRPLVLADAHRLLPALVR